MYLVDYHMHSEYSFDGHETLDCICETAIKKGLREIAITDHMDIYSDKPYEFILDFKKEYPNLQKIKEKYKQKLAIRLGIELGQPQVNPKEAKRFLEDYALDFVIGSIHNMEHDKDVGDYNFAELDCYKVFQTYLDWLIELANNYDYDVIGHITYPLRYMANQNIRLDIAGFEEQVRELYSVIIKRGKGIELNVSGLYQTINDTMPSLPFLKWYLECKGEIITIGSDAHYSKNIGRTIQEGLEILKATGFQYIATYENRKPSFYKI